MYTRLFFIAAFLFLSAGDALARGNAFAGGKIPLTVKEVDALSGRQIYNRTMGKTSLKAVQKVMFDPEKYIAQRGIKPIAGKAIEGRTMIKINRVLVKQGRTDRIVATSVMKEMANDAADLVRVSKSGRILEKFQSKLSGNEAIRALSKTKYDGMKIVTPPDQLKWVQNELAKKVAGANRRGIDLSTKWADVQRAISSGRLVDHIDGVRLPTTKAAVNFSTKHVTKQIASVMRKSVTGPSALSKTASGVTKAAHLAKFGTVLRIGGGVAGIVFGVVDIGGGVYELREIDRRFYAGELDYDIAASKKILAGGRMVLGGTAIAAGILIIVPEPVITKVIAAGLTITIIAGHAVLMVVDYFLERTQAKRIEHRRELLAKISWDTQRTVCLQQLRAMASKM